MRARFSLLLVGGLLLALTTFATAAEPLKGTQPLTWPGDISLRMIDDLHTFADRETAASVERRARHWKRDFSSPEAYAKSVEPNRARLAKVLGVSKRDELPKISVTTYPLPKNGPQYFQEWVSRIEFGPQRVVEAHVCYSHPLSAAKAVVIVLPDAAASPEMFTANEIAEERQYVRKLIASGCCVIIPRMIDLGDEYSVVATGARPTNQTHREFVYRQAFEMGRHPIGLEVEAVRALLSFSAPLFSSGEPRPIGLLGYGEGGLVALCAAALDPRVTTVAVGGYFGPRENLWQEPMYRNVWGLLDEFGDAELASLVAPRALLIEACAAAEIEGPSTSREGRRGAAPGRIVTPSLEEVRREQERLRSLLAPGGATWDTTKLIPSGSDGKGRAGSDEYLTALLERLKLPPVSKQPLEPRRNYAPPPTAAVSPADDDGQRRTVSEAVEHTQTLVRESEYVRKEFFKNADRASRDPAKWEASLAPYRKHLYEEVLGKIDMPLLPPNARTRQIYDEPKYVGYEVVLDVFDNDATTAEANVFAYGVLLVPKDIKSGEKRPVVVCQHGLEGRPRDTIDVCDGERYYHRFAHHLAERGFVTFSPQNPYLGKNHFRQLVRKLQPLKKTLWSFIVPQHEQITAWLASLEFVDADRIGFYGLSYGGKTAMRIPALVDRYCLSICSGDFNEWIRKITSIRDPFSYMGTGEYEIFEFDLGHTFNYAEMAYLIAPRPFMVERGHRDGVGIDEWVAYEYAKVQLLYADLKIPERTEIEYFDGPHEIHAVGTFEFLHRHLKWPERK